MGQTTLAETVKGEGSVTFYLDLYKSGDYTEKTDNSQYPVRVNIRDDVYLEVSALASNDKDLGLLIMDIIATDSPDSDGNEGDYNYYIVKDGCIVDDTFQYI